MLADVNYISAINGLNLKISRRMKMKLKNVDVSFDVQYIFQVMGFSQLKI